MTGEPPQHEARSRAPARPRAPIFHLTVSSPRGCVPTSVESGARRSIAPIAVDYVKDNDDRTLISLRQREDKDAVLHEIEVPASGPRQGTVVIPAGIPISREQDHYELEMLFVNRRGVRHGGLVLRRPPVRFEVLRLRPAPAGEDFLLAQTVFAEGSDAGEFPYIRDLVHNRINWVRRHPRDADSFGPPTITGVLTKEGQWKSVLKQTPAFRFFARELAERSGPCHYTTPPTSGAVPTARLINAAIDVVAAGDGHVHDYVYLRQHNKESPSTRAVDPPWHYPPKGNYYWRISGPP